MSQRNVCRIVAVFTFASAVSLLPVLPSQAATRGERSDSGFTAPEPHGVSWWGALRSLLEKAGVRIDDNGFH